MPAIPSATETVRDFGLGLSSPASMLPVVCGVSSLGSTAALGTAAALEFYSDLQTLRDARGEGPAVETAANILDQGGGPIGFIGMDPTIPAANAPIYATFSVAGTNGAVTKVGTGPTITVAGAPQGHFSMRIAITLGGVLGTSTFRWSTDGGTTWVEQGILTPVGGTYLLGSTGITATFPAGTYVLADTYSWTATGGGGVVALSATATLDAHIRIEILLGGALGVAKFRYCLDGYSGDTAAERTYSETLLVPLGGTFAIPGIGVTITFTATPTFVAGDVYQCDVACAAWNATDLAECGTVLLATSTPWRFLVAIASAGNGDPTAHAVLAAALQSQLTALANRSRPRRAMMACDQGHSAALVTTAFQSVVASRLLLAFGKVRRVTTKPFTGYAFPVTHGVDCFAARAARSLPSTDLKRVKSGPLEEVVRIFRDELNNPTALDDIKISTLRTFDNIDGSYITQARLKSPSGSDFKLWPHGILMDIAQETAHAKTTYFLGQGIRYNSDGTIDDADAASIEAEVGVALSAQLTGPTNAEGTQGYVQDVRYKISRTQNVQQTGVLIGTVGIKPFGYIDYIQTNLGFVVSLAASAAA